jgi:hypothetical protein
VTPSPQWPPPFSDESPPKCHSANSSIQAAIKRDTSAAISRASSKKWTTLGDSCRLIRGDVAVKYSSECRAAMLHQCALCPGPKCRGRDSVLVSVRCCRLSSTTSFTFHCSAAGVGRDGQGLTQAGRSLVTFVAIPLSADTEATPAIMATESATKRKRTVRM